MTPEDAGRTVVFHRLMLWWNTTRREVNVCANNARFAAYLAVDVWVPVTEHVQFSNTDPIDVSGFYSFSRDEL